MKQKLFILLALVFLVVMLVGLNAASYVQKEEKPDTEFYPNRSTYHPGATGTRAFYDLLAETGRKPVRWQEKPAALLYNSKNAPQTFVVIGELRRDFTDEETEHLLRWVSQGGKLVVIDRMPREDLISTTANWKLTPLPVNFPLFELDPSNQPQMTEKTNAAKPLLPTVFTQNVNAVQPSRLAASIRLESFPPVEKTIQLASPTPYASPAYEDDHYDEEDEPPPMRPKSGGGQGYGVETGGNKNAPTVITAATPPPLPPAKVETVALTAPVVHLANNEKILLADFPYGSGQIVFLTDPYIVSNAGISMVDNAQLAINIVAPRASGGVIAFDEYHQGFGGNENRLLAYFSDTPVPAILAQILLLVGVVLFTQSRRFARPLPAIEPSRLSKLEYVSAMAELQQRAKAYDLAIENIYTEFRRRTAKLFGVDNHATTRRSLAKLIGERAKLNPSEVEKLMEKCENIIQGEPAAGRETLDITSRLREIEEKLGMKRTRKQAFRK